MTKILSKFLFFSIIVTPLKAIDFKGEFHIKDAPVIAANKIVIYKEGDKTNGKDGLVFNYKIQKNKIIDETKRLGEQIYWIKQIPQGPGLTENEIRETGNIVAKDKIEVGMAKVNGTALYYSLNIDPLITFSECGMGDYNIVKNLGIKATYNDNLKLFLAGTVGSVSGEVRLNGRFSIRIKS